jgi:murein DD-endopeptidase MepM/ murein hydrolase activator NlpD
MATFPLNKQQILMNNSTTEFLDNYTYYTEIPLLPHPGAFSAVRKNHIHEGIDLYCNHGDDVLAIEEGIVVNIFAFTGKQCGSPWWNDTWAVMIEGRSGVFNYGEIKPNENLKIGNHIQEGQKIGQVVQVLTKDKGRPMNMLHLELYQHGTKQAITEWSLNTDKANELVDPTAILINIAQHHHPKQLKM